MKFHQILLSAFVFITACSSPKFVYHFDHYDYNAGKKSPGHIEVAKEESPLSLVEKNLTVSSTTEPVVIAEKNELT